MGYFTVGEEVTAILINNMPGILLATQQYAPGTLANYTLGTTLAAIDTTNLTLAFTVPPSGNVDVEVHVTANVAATSGSGNAVFLGLLNHSGGAQIGLTIPVIGVNAADVENNAGFVRPRFHLTGLTPGATVQVDLAGVVTGNTAGLGGSVQARGTTGNAQTGVPGSPAIMQAFAA